MKPDPSFLRTLREALRQATRDLDSLKLKKTDETPELSQLRRELRSVILKDYARFAKRGSKAVSSGQTVLRTAFPRPERD